MTDKKPNQATLRDELCAWLDQQTINGDNIGSIRARLIMPWSSEWNAVVRDETSAREIKRNPCPRCNDTGKVDSGGFTPWGASIDLPCPECTSKWDDLAIIGASWLKDSSLEKWFPFTADELMTLKALNMALRDALRGLKKLIDDGDLVRNTANDADLVAFMRQGVKINNALVACQL